MQFFFTCPLVVELSVKATIRPNTRHGLPPVVSCVEDIPQYRLQSYAFLDKAPLLLDKRPPPPLPVLRCYVSIDGSQIGGSKIGGSKIGGSKICDILTAPDVESTICLIMSVSS